MNGQPNTLLVQDFAQIRRAELDFGDLTVLVGPQATGKSLVLQLWKLIQDHAEVVTSLKAAGFRWSGDADFIQQVLGQGWDTAWTANSKIKAGARLWSLRDLRRQKAGDTEEGNVFYIPAQRTLVLENGWPKLFQQFTPDTPYVVRQFSQTLHGVVAGFTSAEGRVLFPHAKRLKAELKNKLDEAVFHGARLTLNAEGMRWQLGLEYNGDVRLGFMSWTAGQREVSPLLLGLYHLLPPAALTKREHIDWVVIEEPEMGLHPQATVAILLVVLDLVSRGYRVIMSSHAPIVLDVIFALRHLQELQDPDEAERRFLEAFRLKRSAPTLKLAREVFGKRYKVYAFEYYLDNRVRSTDITNLDPGSTNQVESSWGGLTGLSSEIANAAFASGDRL